ncbi:TIGR03668 family PPOX class F420-dependent oxidoreductase, partial [Candidatus Binatia bacterium]|nr:TIGR03668 family PPOX class F420-dependent oxidoreductase [Candidatus Binatia bacterium]
AATSLDRDTRAFVERARRAHLATASATAEPHVVPLCFAVLDARTLAFAVDDKPKPAGRTLKRLRNVAENPRFALVIDRWSEDWRRLGYVLISGRAQHEPDARRRASAVRALRARYPQYRAMDLDARRHQIVLLEVERVHAWGRIAAAPARSAPGGGVPRTRR